MSMKEVQKVIDRLAEANEKLDRQLEEQNDHCLELLEQIKNNHNGKVSPRDVPKEKE